MVTIRNATSADPVEISRMCMAAFWTDAFMGDIIHPHRHDFPDDMHMYFLKRLRREMGKPGNVFLVSTVTGEHGKEIITGFSHWERKTGSKKDGVTGKDESGGLDGETLPVNRACDPEMEDVIERAAPWFGVHWQGGRAESWYLSLMAVHPSYHGQGHGKALTRFGFEQAEKERVSVSVVSAAGAEGFYRRCGFDKHVGQIGQGEGNPLADIPGGDVLFKDVV